MDEKLIEINKIRNLEYVSFYDITVSDKDGNIKRNVLAPALMIKADGKTLNYSIMDKFFGAYVHKVISVYHKEKNKTPVEGAVPSIIPNGISFDNENSKKILEDASFLEEKDITEFYNNKDSYDDTLIFEIDDIKAIMDIVRYVINYFAIFNKKAIKLSDSLKGYHTKYSIDGEIEKKLVTLRIRYKKISDNEFDIEILNLAGVCKSYNVKIRFMDNRVSINGKCDDLEICNEFKIDQDGGSYINIVYWNKQMVLYEPGELEKVNVDYNNLVNLDNENNLVWYQLPWNAYLGTNTIDEEVNEKARIITNHIMYLDVIGDSFYKREYYKKILARENAKTKRVFKITVDELRKITFGFKDRDHYLIETSFKKALGDGEYQEKYSDKYFYHIVRTSELSNVRRDTLIPVTKNIVSNENDLLEREKVKRIGEKR